MGTAACRECGVEADACCADIGYPCCWFCTVTNVAHLPATLAEKCDRICGVHARYHKDRCPLYKGNCAAMDAMNRKVK